MPRASWMLTATIPFQKFVDVMNQANTHRNGFTLIYVLWAVLFLSSVTFLFLSASRTQTDAAHYRKEGAKAEALAEAGINLAIWNIKQVDREERWSHDGAPYKVEMPNGTAIVRIQDEDGRIDANFATRELLESLLVSVGVRSHDSAIFSDRIISAREPYSSRATLSDSDNFDGTDVDSPEHQRQVAFTDVAQLQSMLELEEETYQRLREAMTVFSGRSGFDPSRAPKESLLALPGASYEWVSDYLESRNENASPPVLPEASRAFARRSRSKIFLIRVRGETKTGSKATREVVVDIRPQNNLSYRLILHR